MKRTIFILTLSVCLALPALAQWSHKPIGNAADRKAELLNNPKALLQKHKPGARSTSALFKTVAITQQLDSIDIKEPLGGGTFQTMFKYGFEYVNSRLSKEIWYELDYMTNIMQPFYEDQLTYNAQGNLATQITSLWDVASANWYAVEKLEVTYNSANDVQKSEYFGWDSTSAQWMQYSREEYSYNSNGDLSEAEYFFLNMSVWEPFVKTQYLYNSSNQLIESEYFIYNSLTSQYEPAFKDVNTYNAAGELSQVISLFYDSNTSQFENDSRTTLTYTPIKRTEVADFWNGMAWEAYAKFETNLDLSGNEVSAEEFEMNANNWEPLYKSGLTYDMNELMSNVAYPGWLGDVFTLVNVPVSAFYSEYNGSSYDMLQDVVFYYSQVFVSLNEDLVGKVRIFPNPASDYLSVELDDNKGEMGAITIYDLKGATALESAIIATPINISSLPKGLYLYQISSSKGLVNGKFIKE